MISSTALHSSGRYRSKWRADGGLYNPMELQKSRKRGLSTVSNGSPSTTSQISSLSARVVVGVLALENAAAMLTQPRSSPWIRLSALLMSRGCWFLMASLTAR